MRVLARLVPALLLLCAAAAPAAAESEPAPMIMFGGQLVRSTTLDGVPSIDVGGGGALYVSGTRAYWGGGGGSVIQLGDTSDATELEMFHGSLWLGYDLVQASGTFVSATALAGGGMTKEHDGVFGLVEGRLAARRQLARWFMLGTHVAYRRAFASDVPMVGNGGLSGPVLGLELYFIH